MLSLLFLHRLTYNSRMLLRNTVFIQINAQPRISAHLEKAPILKAEKVNKRPALPPQSILQEPCFATSSSFVISIYCFFAK